MGAMNNLLPTAIEPAVWLQIAMLKARGGPAAEDMQKAQETSHMLGERGDILLCGGGRKGECAELFNRTAHASAVLAFVPGGVTVFGRRFEANGTPQKERTAA